MPAILQTYTYQLIWIGMAAAVVGWLLGKVGHAEMCNWLGSNDPDWVDETDTARKDSVASSVQHIAIVKLLVHYHVEAKDAVRYRRLRLERGHGAVWAYIWPLANMATIVGAIVMLYGMVGYVPPGPKP